MPFLCRRALGAGLLGILLAVAAQPVLAQAPEGAPAASSVDAAVGSPSDLPVLRLDALLEQVRMENPSLEAARLEAAALGQRAPQVSALPDPMVMATYQPLPLLTARGAQRSQWRVEQPIPYPGKLALYGEVAVLSADVAAHEAAVLGEDLVLQVKRAYYELYRIQEQQRLVAAFQERLAEFEQIATTQYEVGTGMQQAILKAQLEKNGLAQRLLTLAREYETARATLARLTNAPVAGSFEVVVEAPRPRAVPEAPTLGALAERARPEADALRAAEARADAQVALARKAFRPDFGVNVTYFDLAASDVMPTATGRDALAVGVSVKVPLQRGRLRAGLEEARLRAAQVEARQEALATSFVTEIADAASRLEREADQLDVLRTTLIPQASSTQEATLAAYTTGRIGFLDLLDAERMLFALRMNVVDTEARYLQAVALLERALGVSSLADIDAARLTLPTPSENR